jgi:hypothetical protein
MKKYSEIAPLVKANLNKINTDVERSFTVKEIENVMSKHNVSSISDLPLEIKAKILNGEGKF